MIFPDITFITKQGDERSHPRGHLRWMELDGNGLKFGFSSGSVILRGQNLGLLLGGVIRGGIDEVQERPVRSAEAGKWEVHDMRFGDAV